MSINPPARPAEREAFAVRVWPQVRFRGRRLPAVTDPPADGWCAPREAAAAAAAAELPDCGVQLAAALAAALRLAASACLDCTSDRSMSLKKKFCGPTGDEYR